MHTHAHTHIHTHTQVVPATCVCELPCTWYAFVGGSGLGTLTERQYLTYSQVRLNQIPYASMAHSYS